MNESSPSNAVLANRIDNLENISKLKDDQVTKTLSKMEKRYDNSLSKIEMGVEKTLERINKNIDRQDDKRETFEKLCDDKFVTGKQLMYAWSPITIIVGICVTALIKFLG